MKLNKILLLSFAIVSLLPTILWSSEAQSRSTNFMEKSPSFSGDYDDENFRSITLGKSRIIEADDDIADVLVGDLSILEVGAIKKNKLYLIGAALGDTNIMLFDGDGEVIDKFNVHVRVDKDTLQNTLRSLFPNEEINVKTVSDDVILTGRVSSPEVARKIEEIAERFAGEDIAGNLSTINMMSVSGEQQVSLEVKVMEVSRTVLNELGIELGGTYTSSDFAAAFGSNRLGLNEATPVLTGAANTTFGDLTLNTLFSALERDGYVSTLAEPNLTAITGENARFLAGGEFPIVVGVDTDDDGSRDVTYDYRPLGVSLAFKPVVLSKNRINLNIATEVSNISNELNLVLSGLTIPGFDVRRAETTVELPSGGTLVLAGLIESGTVHNLNNVPGARNIPIIGDLMSSESFSRNETELVITVRAILVKPFSDSEMADDHTNHDKNLPINQSLANQLKEIYGNEIENKIQAHNIGYLID